MSKPARTPRMRKVNELLREVIAEEVSGLKDPRIGFVTITGVDTAPDLRNARVYFSVLGDDEERKSTGEGLQHAAPRIQAAMGRQVRLKYLPKLHFVIDEAIERGMRMEELLRGLHREDEHQPDGPDGEDAHDD